MLRGLLTKIVGDANEKELKRLQPVVEQVNALEAEVEALVDEKLGDKTQKFIGWLHAGETLDDILPGAFAAVREASKRTTNLRHFDVQLIGGALLHEGKVVEMKTGEGKTLVATLPAYLNALAGQGVHIVTVNDYLARRDVQWMGPIYHLLGLDVGLLQQGEDNAFLFDPTYKRGKFQHLRPVSRKEAYLADITYGTNNEFGFDYLRDNLATDLDRRVQRELHYAIVDEVDNVFIDQARTPLIISGYLSHEEQEREAEDYRRFANIARKLKPDVHYELDEKEQSVSLTDAGLARVEEETGVENIYDEANYRYVHYMEQALKARVLFLQGRDYISQHGRIVLIDHFTGRLMPDRRLSEGLHQAIEAKEGVKIMPRTMTQATITIQNYFRLYKKLAGMTGTAATEAEEFYKIYDLDTAVLPTNVAYTASRPASGLVEARRKDNGFEITVYHSRENPDDVLFFKRVDYPDVIYRSEEAKWQAIIQEIQEGYQVGRPVLVGTTSVEKSEALSRRLRAKGIEHQVLYAKNHTQEARIIARAGEPGMITVATQMAGRGVDVKLGGELSDETVAKARRLIESKGLDFFQATPEQFYSAIAEVEPEYVRRREKVLKQGGLHIIGTERHEARRIDNQLRGRAGRQGEPGSSRFYLSLEDDLMRRFGGERVKGLMERLGVEDNIPIEHGLVNRTIEGSQSRIEGYNFDIRKHLLEYDDVLNRQRTLIYDQRHGILTRDDLRPDLREMVEAEIDERLAKVSPEPDRERELWAFLDHVLPLWGLPQDVPFPPPFSLATNWRCFPPYTISFLAGRMQGLTPQILGQKVLDISRQASDAYREYLLDKVISEPLQRIEEKYRENQETLADILEQKIDDYVELAEERGKAVNFRDLLQHLQRTFPLPLDVKRQQLKNRTPSEAREVLLAALDRSYNQKVCADLIQWVQARTPAALRLDNVQLADLDIEDVKRLLAQAMAGSYDERAEARLAQLALDLEGGKSRQAKYNPGKLIEELSKLASIEVGSLEPILRQAVAVEYTRWIERQLREVNEEVRENVDSSPNTESRQEVVQLLLNIYYAEVQSFDRAHKKRTTFVSRIPLSFLMATIMQGVDGQELRPTILAHLKAALDEREKIWGEQELQRWGQRRLEDLDRESYQSLLRHLGESKIGAGKGLRIGELDRELYETLRCYLGIQGLEEQRLADLDPGMRDALMDYLGRELIERVSEQRIVDLDEETRRWIEEYLQSIGYFEDEDAEQQLFARRIEDLDGQTFDGIALRLGQERLADCQGLPIGDLESDTRQAARDYLKRRGYFTDDKKVQNFLVYQRLSDLEAETRRQACLSLARGQLDRVRDREIERLDLNTRRAIMNCLREAGFFTDETRRQEIARGRLADLDQETLAGFGQHLGRSRFANGQIVAELEEDVRRYVLDRLKRDGYFEDQAVVDSLPQQRLSDLEPRIYEDVQQRLRAEMRADLEQYEIGDLGQYLQERISAYLDEIEYFTDQDKVQKFKRQALAQIAPETAQGLVRHLGSEWMSTFDNKLFMNLEREVRESILHHFDTTDHFTDKAAKKRFIRTQTLSELDREVYMNLARHLGRGRWDEIKRYRFDELPEELQRSIWLYLKEVRYFTDHELEEMISQVKIAALEPETREGLLAHINRDLEELVAERCLGEWPTSLQARIRRYLDERGYSVDRSKVEEFARTPASRMEQEIYEVVTSYLAQHLLARCNSRPIEALESKTQDLLWHYLDQAEYFVDRNRQREYAQTRLGDLPPQIYEQIVDHLSHELEQEIGEQLVADLEDSLKRDLQEYLEETGYFVDEEKLARLDSQALSEWREELDGLALFLGQRQLYEMRGQRLSDLPPTAQVSVVNYAREEEYLRDEKKYQAFQQQPLANLDDEVKTQVFRVLRQEQERAIRDQRMADLDEETRRSIWQFLEERGFALDETQMQRLKRQRLTDLDAEVYDGFVRYLGTRQVKAIGDSRIAELDGETRQTVRAFWGRRVMHQVQKDVMLHFISRLWIDYLTDIEDLRQGIGLQAYGQRDPLVEYKRQAFEMFDALQDNIRRSVVTSVFRWPPRPLKAG